MIDPDRDDADLLDDDSILLTTRAAFGDADDGREILRAYGPELTQFHTDAHGVLFFPESFYPNARTYEGVLAALEGVGVWVPTSALGEPGSVDLVQQKRSSVRAHNRALAGRTVLAPFRQKLGTPSSSAEESFERLQAMFQRPHVVAALMRATMAEVLLLRARRALPRRPLFRGGTRVIQHHVLPDGTAMFIVDIKGVRKREVVAHVLATSTRVQSWLDEHDDPRGVPYVLSRDVERLARAQTYEDALGLAEVEVTFVRPQRREEQVEERKARLRSALAWGGHR